MEELLRTLIGLADDLAVAAVAGWVAGRVVAGKAPSLAASLICGILGWLIGRGLLAVLGAGFFGLPVLLVSFLTALCGAAVLWLSLPLLKRA
ncbi:MAG: hypothetical protein K0S81_3632 [Rhodospirillales bacterium]|jgi:uncharacterized membrane protein YeaQ/YmgE (transglycosylase-associated protein family)|nr:hypothetical protein [Rhodospirillales bacterium]